MNDTTDKRWLATITYRSECGPVAVKRGIEELDELADMVERGPDWNCVMGISVTLARIEEPGLTLERAAEL